MAFVNGVGSSKTSGSGAVTYRHLLSKQSLTPMNPLRVIAHCDIDAAYAQFEAVRLKLDPSVPVACQQWTGLIAINYPARAFGITRHMDVHEAKRKCPELVAVHVATYKEGEDEAGYFEDAKPETHKVSLEPYRRESLKILKVFSEFCSTIEKASIDEAYIDFSGPVRDLIIVRNPHLAKPPAESDLGLDTPLPPPPSIDWDGLGNIVPVLSEKEQKAAEATGKDGEGGSESGPGDTSKSEEEKQEKQEAPPSSQIIEQPSDPINAWSDYALSIGAELMQKCRAQVRQQLGYTCSAGVARNKILAKLCSAYVKPNAQTILRNDAIPSFLRPLKFTKIRSLGGKLGQTIAEEYDAATVGDMWDVPLRDLQGKVGSEGGSWVYNVLRGLEYGEVSAKTDVKSMLSSKSFRPPLKTMEEISYWMRIIATDLYARLNEAREISPGIWPKTIVLGFRDDTPGLGPWQTRHRQGSFPVTNTLTIDYVAKYGERLLKEYMGERNKIGPYFIISLSFTGLERAEKGQQAIQGFFGAGAANGSGAAGPSRGSSLPLAKPSKQSAKALGKRKASEEFVDLTAGSSDVDVEAVDGNGARTDGSLDPAGDLSLSSDDDELAEIEPTGPVYRCPACKAIMSVRQSEGETLDDATQRIGAKHEAWHASSAAPSRKKQKASTNKKKKGQQKLKAFFGKS